MTMTLENVRTKFKMVFDSSRDAHIILKSLEPEINTSPSERSSAQFKIEGNVLEIVIVAADTPSIRAALNSYLRWIILCYDVLKLKNNS